MASKKEDLVPLFIPKIPGTSNEDFPIGHNGRFYTVRRGEEVMVPPGVAQIYYDSVYAQEKADERAEAARAKIGG